MNDRSKMLDQLVNNLKTAHADNLVSVTLYGSSAVEDAGRHDVLVVLKRIELDDLRAAIEPVRNWTRQGQPMPVYFSQDELRSAADVFPIEFLQMEQARKQLYGPDPFESVEISQTNLRHQTEYELRTKSLQLRRLYLPAANSPDRLVKLMTDSLPSFASVFRAVLMLHGTPPPISKRAAVQATVRVLGLDGSAFDRIFELTGKDKARLKREDAELLFGEYLMQIQRVIDAVDQIEQA
jgi:hypothetical protein